MVGRIDQKFDEQRFGSRRKQRRGDERAGEQAGKGREEFRYHVDGSGVRRLIVRRMTASGSDVEGGWQHDRADKRR